MDNNQEVAAHTPPVENAPATQEAHTPLQAEPEASTIIEDLGETPVIQEETPAAAEDDPSLIQSREHYLREMRKLREREAAIAEREAKLAEKGEKPEEKEPPADGEEGERTPVDPEAHQRLASAMQTFNEQLDPNDWESEGDQVLVKQINALKVIGDRLGEWLASQQEQLQTMAQSSSQLMEAHQQQQAKQIYTIMQGGAAAVMEEYGLDVSVEDVGEALRKWAKVIAKENNGVLPPNAGFQAYFLEHRESLRKVQSAKGESPKPQQKVPGITRGADSRTNGTPLSDEEMILAQLQAGG